MRAAAAAVLVLVLALPAWGAEPRRATLQLRDLTPLVVEGRGFRSRERVVLTASLPTARRTLTIVARRDGRFRGGFRLRPGRCVEFTVRAVGAAGSRAILQVDPDC